MKPIFFITLLASQAVWAQQNPEVKHGQSLASKKYDEVSLKGEALSTVKSYPAPNNIVFAMQEGSKEKGSVEPGPHYNYWPVIVTGSKEKPEKIFSLEKEFKSWEWAEVRADLKKGYFWGILEFTVEGPSHTLPIIASFDRGKSWKYLSDIPKGNFMMSLLGFFMNGKGFGEAIFESDAVNPRTSRARTANWGKSWTLVKENSKDVLDGEPLTHSFLNDCQASEGSPRPCAFKWE